MLIALLTLAIGLIKVLVWPLLVLFFLLHWKAEIGLLLKKVGGLIDRVESGKVSREGIVFHCKPESVRLTSGPKEIELTTPPLLESPASRSYLAH